MAREGPLTEKTYLDALARNMRLWRRKGIDAVMNRFRLDASTALTGSPAWTTDLVSGDHCRGASSPPAAVAGYPSLALPAGTAFGLRVGISFIGRAWSEAPLLTLAYAYQQAAKYRPPTFPATADLAAR